MGILGRTIGVRMAQRLDEWEARPDVQRMLERRQAAWELADMARAAAGTGATDEEACGALGERLPEDHCLVALATRDLAAERTSYLDDRAYRLLTAAALPGPVRPIDPHVRGLFEAERALGRRSLTEAFETLAALEPRLRDEVAREWESCAAWTRTAHDGAPPPNERGRRPTLTGMYAGGTDPLLHSELASVVTREYAIVTRGGRLPDPDPTPFFERELHFGCSTVVCGDDRRPRACN